MPTYHTSLHGRPTGGPTRGRPLDKAHGGSGHGPGPYGGMVYFDTDLGVLLYWDSEAEEYRPIGVAGGSGPMPQALVEDMPGALNFDGTRLTMSDGANEWGLAEEPESSSSSTGTSSSASSASSDSSDSSDSSGA